MHQKVTLIGWVGQDPEMRRTQDGTLVATFTLATSQWRSKESSRTCPKGWEESRNGRSWQLTTWWRVTCWDWLAEFVNGHVSRGKQLFVEGEVTGDAQDGKQTPHVWTGRDDVVRASFELKARNVVLLGKREKNRATESPRGGSSAAGAEEGLTFP